MKSKIQFEVRFNIKNENGVGVYCRSYCLSDSDINDLKKRKGSNGLDSILYDFVSVAFKEREEEKERQAGINRRNLDLISGGMKVYVICYYVSRVSSKPYRFIIANNEKEAVDAAYRAGWLNSFGKKYSIAANEWTKKLPNEELPVASDILKGPNYLR